LSHVGVARGVPHRVQLKGNHHTSCWTTRLNCNSQLKQMDPVTGYDGSLKCDRHYHNRIDPQDCPEGISRSAISLKRFEPDV
jgi:hypothetical protein